MITTNTVFKLVIPQWKNKIEISKIPKKYYAKGDKLPKKYNGATLKRFGSKYLYVDSDGNKIVKNPTKAGKSKYWNLNGQQFYSTNMHWALRKKIVDFYHKYFSEYIKKEFKEPFPIFLSYSITMEVKIYEVYSKFTPDITNMWILPKMIEDAMVNNKIIRDDSPQFRLKTSYEYIFVKDESKRKLVIKFKYKKI